MHGTRLHLVLNKLYKKQPTSSGLSVAPVRFWSSIMVLKRLRLTYSDVTLHRGTINLMNRASMGLVWLLCWPCSLSASLHLAHSRSSPSLLRLTTNLTIKPRLELFNREQWNMVQMFAPCHGRLTTTLSLALLTLKVYFTQWGKILFSSHLNTNREFRETLISDENSRFYGQSVKKEEEENWKTKQTKTGGELL